MNEKKTYSYEKIRHFTDIEAWKRARELRNEVYGIVKKLPSEEKYDLGSQMRKAGVSCRWIYSLPAKQQEKTKEVANY